MIGLERASRYAELARRLLNDEEAEILAPGFIFEVDRPEWWILGSKMAWIGLNSVGASAANFSQAAIVPPDITTLTVIEGATVGPGPGGAAGDYSMYLSGTVPLATVGRVTPRDMRAPVSNLSTLIEAQNTTPALGGVGARQQRVSVLANTTVPIIRCPIILGLGGKTPAVCMIASEVINRPMDVNWWGYERAMLPLELAKALAV